MAVKITIWTVFAGVELVKDAVCFFVKLNVVVGDVV